MVNRRPLGRGLDALIENTTADAAPAAAQASGAGVMTVPCAQIAPSPFQPRMLFNEERLAELAKAIASQGIIEPLIVRTPAAAQAQADGYRYELIAGERRLRAAKIAGLQMVPVVIREGMDDRAALEMSLVENLSREDLNPVEEGQALKRLYWDFGMGHEEIAERIGKSRPYVSNAIRLTDLPSPVLEMIAYGQLTTGQARPLLTLASKEMQIEAARKIVAEKTNARDAEAIAGEHRRDRGPRGAGDPNLAAISEGLQRALKRKVRIVRRRGRKPGRIEMEYYDDSDLTALVRALVASTRAPAAS